MKTTRRERTLETRRRMLRAGYALFCELGYATTTMEAIAAKADVAVQTLYFTFGTKAVILSEALGSAIIGFDRFEPPPPDFDAREAPKTLFSWWPAFEQAKHPRKALEIFIAANNQVMVRAAPLIVIMQAARGDPEVRAIHELAETRRVESYQTVARVIAGKRGLRHATDLLLAISSPALFLELRARGWSVRACSDFMVDVLAAHLLP